MTTPLFSYRKYWAECFGPAPELPMSRAEMDALGWDSCDIIIVTGDAYVDHPSFGMAVIGRALEAQGFRVGIIAQPDWTSAEPFTVLGKPNLFFGVAAGNMDSMINRYTADRKRRNDDAYTPGNEGGKRPDRAVIVYSQRVREAYKDVPLIIGSIEASLRRIAHYDYWSDKVRRSILLDSRADLLLYGNAERAIVEIAHRLAEGEPVKQIRDLRGTAFVCKRLPQDYRVIDSSQLDVIGPVEAPVNPYIDTRTESCASTSTDAVASEPEVAVVQVLDRPRDTGPAVIRLLRAGARRPGAVRPRLPHPAQGDQPLQRAAAGPGPRRPRTVAEPAADTAGNRRARRSVRAALHPAAAQQLRRGPHPRV